MEVDEIRQKFNKLIADMISKKREDNKAFLSKTEYDSRIVALKSSKKTLQTPGMKKTMKDYRIVQKYDILTIGGKERLIKPVVDNSKPVKYYLTNDELFDIVHDTHLAIGHGGRNRMAAELKKKYCNITNEAIMVYLSLCTHCQKKSSHPKKSLVSKLILDPAFISRAQLDIIDMQSQSCGDFKFIMAYQDDLTKFVILKALKSKRAEEVAFHLLEICLMFGAPAILHSDNGLEFVNSVLTELHRMWNGVKIVHGKPRQNQNQGSVEREDIENKLFKWMNENSCADWPSALKFVQFEKNCAFHSGIGRSPYESLFGYSARVGLASLGISNDELKNLTSEEDMEALLANEKSIEDTQELLNNPQDQNFELVDLNATALVSNETLDAASEEVLGSSEEKSCNNCHMAPPLNSTGICFNCERQSSIPTERKRSREFLEKQAKKVIRLSNQEFKCVDAGTTVPVPLSDLRLIDPENTTIKEETDTYLEIDTKEEILDPLETFTSTTQFSKETTLIKCEKAQTDNNLEDENSFGKFVAMKLCSYDLNVQHAVRAEILDIFHRADQGYYVNTS